MSHETARSTVTVAVGILAILLALWMVRFVIGAFVRLAQVAFVGAAAVVAIYAGYRLWIGWRRAGP